MLLAASVVPRLRRSLHARADSLSAAPPPPSGSDAPAITQGSTNAAAASANSQSALIITNDDDCSNDDWDALRYAHETLFATLDELFFESETARRRFTTTFGVGVVALNGAANSDTIPGEVQSLVRTAVAALQERSAKTMKAAAGVIVSDTAECALRRGGVEAPVLLRIELAGLGCLAGFLLGFVTATVEKHATKKAALTTALEVADRVMVVQHRKTSDAAYVADTVAALAKKPSLTIAEQYVARQSAIFSSLSPEEDHTGVLDGAASVMKFGKKAIHFGAAFGNAVLPTWPLREALLELQEPTDSSIEATAETSPPTQVRVPIHLACFSHCPSQPKSATEDSQRLPAAPTEWVVVGDSRSASVDVLPLDDCEENRREWLKLKRETGHAGPITLKPVANGSEKKNAVVSFVHVGLRDPNTNQQVLTVGLTDGTLVGYNLDELVTVPEATEPPIASEEGDPKSESTAVSSVVSQRSARAEVFRHRDPAGLSLTTFAPLAGGSVLAVGPVVRLLRPFADASSDNSGDAVTNPFHKMDVCSESMEQLGLTRPWLSAKALASHESPNPEVADFFAVVGSHLQTWNAIQGECLADVDMGSPITLLRAQQAPSHSVVCALANGCIAIYDSELRSMQRIYPHHDMSAHAPPASSVAMSGGMLWAVTGSGSDGTIRGYHVPVLSYDAEAAKRDEEALKDADGNRAYPDLLRPLWDSAVGGTTALTKGEVLALACHTASDGDVLVVSSHADQSRIEARSLQALGMP